MEKEIYIFDLYGTLIDIHTDETGDDLWAWLADTYARRGVSYTLKQIRENYQYMVRQEERRLSAKTHIPNAEIELSRVFARLLYEHPSYKPENDPLAADRWSRKSQIPKDTVMWGYLEDYDIYGTNLRYADSMDLTSKYEPWILELAGQFRQMSRDMMHAYDDTIPTLKALKEAGKKIYLLSNAQTIFTVPEMEQCGIMSYFDGIFISSEQSMKKPQKQFMERLLRDFNIDRQKAVMVGNEFASDIRVAIESGIDSVFLNTGGYSQEDCQRMMQDTWRDYQEHKISMGLLSRSVADEQEMYLPRVIMDGKLSGLLGQPEILKMPKVMEISDGVVDSNGAPDGVVDVEFEDISTVGALGDSSKDSGPSVAMVETVSTIRL